MNRDMSWFLLGAAALVFSVGARADRVVAVIPPSLPVYERPGAATPVETIRPRGLPWAVLDTKQDFVQVEIDGRKVWLDALDVRLDRKAATSACRQAPVRAAAVAGVSGAAGAAKCP